MGAGTYIQFALALLFVLGLIGVLAVVARRAGFGYGVPAKTGRRRLAVAEVLPLDGRRKLVLLRRDQTEHLVILGPTSETVVERSIPVVDAEEAVPGDAPAAASVTPAPPPRKTPALASPGMSVGDDDR